MRTTISILLCKLISWVCKIFGPMFKKEGSVLPGRCVSKIHKNVLKKLVYPKNVVVITGSSGKGSTTAMVAHILEGCGKKVIWNKNGSNVRTAIITLILNNTKALSHRVDADVVLLEMDERFITGTFKPGTISLMAITNLTRDQPARNIHPDVIFDKIMESTDKDMTLLLNGDDPLVMKAAYRHLGNVMTFGVAQTKYDATEAPSYAVDGAYCPSCQTKLVYEAYHYGHIGIYACPQCRFGRGELDYEATDVDLERGTFKLDGEVLKLNKKVFFGVYYTLLAAAICDIIKIDKKQVIKEINEDVMSSKRGKSYTLRGRKVEMLESKNENALSYLQSLDYIKMQGGKKTVIMGFENVSRRYKYNDLSWLWDVPMERLADESIDKIFCIGRFRYDVAVRLEYAGVPEEKIVSVSELSTLLDMVKNESKGDIYTMVCFDMTAIIKEMLKEQDNEKDN